MLKFRKKHFIFSLFAIPATYVFYLDNPQLNVPAAIAGCIFAASLGYFILLPSIDRLIKTLDRLTGLEKLRKKLEQDDAP